MYLLVNEYSANSYYSISTNACYEAVLAFPPILAIMLRTRSDKTYHGSCLHKTLSGGAAAAMARLAG